MPSADVNLAEGSSAELRIPYCYGEDFWYFNEADTVDSIGVVVVSPYGPVQWDTTTVSTPSYTLYYWMEDIESIGRSAPYVQINPQGRETSYPRVSSWFKAASDVATYAASIPSLTYLAAPLGWAFSATAKIAAHFGWSKPYEGSAGSYMLAGYARAINTCADADHLQPLGYYANNAIAVLPGFAASDIDEMSICSIVCKPGLIASFPLLATDNAGQLKWTTPVAPACFVFQTSVAVGFAQQDCMSAGTTATSGNKPGFIPSPINYVASNFARWRGDLIFRFRFTRTKFHAGRILIGFVPADSPWDGTSVGSAKLAPATIARYDYHSAIIDLRTTSEYDFEVPWTYSRAYCNVGMEVAIPGPHAVPSTGFVFLRVIDPLYGPDNVMPQITVLVEVLAKCGLEFAQPITSQLIPLSDIDPQILIAQARDLHHDAAATASGERILSIKQLLARPTWQYLFEAGVRTLVNEASVDYYFPARFAAVTGLPYLTPVSVLNFPYSTYSAFAAIFGLVRGSKIARAVPALSTSSTPANFASTFAYFPTAQHNDFRSGAISMEHNTSNAVSIPYYGRHNRTKTGWCSHVIGADGRSLIIGAGCTDSSYLLGVAAGDDLQFGAFNGIPPVVVADPSLFNPLDLYMNGVSPPAP
jgi:hypothetical protein